MFDFFNKTKKAAKEIQSLVMYAQMTEGEIKKNHIDKAKTIIEKKVLKLEKKALKDATPNLKFEIEETIKIWKDVIKILNTNKNQRDALIYINHIINKEREIKKEILHYEK